MNERARFALRFGTVALGVYTFCALVFVSLYSLLFALAIAVATSISAYLLGSLGRSAGGAVAVGVVIALLGHFGGYALVGMGINVVAWLEGAPLSLSKAGGNILVFMLGFIFNRIDLLVWLPLGGMLGREWLWLQKPRVGIGLSTPAPISHVDR